MTIQLERPVPSPRTSPEHRLASECHLRLLASPASGDGRLTLLIALGGDADGAGLDAVRARLALLVGSGHDIALDLTGVAYADDRLRELLVDCIRAARRRGSGFRVVAASPPAARALAGPS